MPTEGSNNKSVWSAKNIYDLIFSTYGNAHVKANRKRHEEASKYTIPYIPEKEITLTTGRYNTGKISTNLLDSIYNSAQRTGVPIDIALGLAGRESTLGIGRGFKKGQSVSGTDLYSNWQQLQSVPNTKSQIERWNDLLNKDKSELTEEDYNFKSDFIMRSQEALESIKPLEENPIDNALKLYTTGKYNPGDKNHSKMVEKDAEELMSDPAIQKWLKTKNNGQMKCGGRRKAQLGLDIREGGIAIPIANNMYYMDGRSHDEGGIAIGPNNKNGLEVEGGEVVKVGNKDIKVFSSVPLLRGASPAQLVLGGANPNTVFKAQEEFKDRNRINDDGTRYEIGGEKKIYEMPFAQRVQYARTGKITNTGYPVTPLQKSYSALRALGRFRTAIKDRPWRLDEAFNSAIKGAMNDAAKTPVGWDKQYNNKGLQFIKAVYNRVVGNKGQNLGITKYETEDKQMKAGGIYIKPSKRGTFTAAATKHGMSVQGFASKVLANKENYSSAMVKKANFARNASRWKKEYGGSMIYEINGNVKNGLMSVRPKAEWGKGKDDEKWKFVSDPENFVRGYRINTPYGKLYSDGTSYLDANGEITWHTSPKFMDKAIKYQVNKRPQYYAEKRLPIAGGQSIAEKAGLARSGWSYADSPTFDYVPNINISVPTNYAKAVGDNSKKSTGSTARGEGTQSTATPTNPNEARYASRVQKGQAQEVTTQPVTTYDEAADKNPDKNRYTRATNFGKPSDVPAKPGNTATDDKDEEKTKNTPWIGQYKPVRTEDWIGLGSNLAGSVASYFMTKNAINKTPNPIKPVMAQAAKLKTKYNVEPQLTELRETEQMNRAAVRRNTQSSNASLAREQRLMNEARGARNTLYGQKENIETQLINQDRLNRQSVYQKNVDTYNNYLNRIYLDKQHKAEARISNINNLIGGLTGSVNNMLNTIETRRTTNNTLRAIAAANPNVDARLIGGFDYYEALGPDGKRKALYDKHQKFVRYI